MQLSHKLFIIIESIFLALFLFVEGLILNLNVDAFNKQALVMGVIYIVIFSFLRVFEFFKYKKDLKKLLILVIPTIAFLLFGLLFNPKIDTSYTTLYERFIYALEFSALLNLFYNGVIYKLHSKNEIEVKDSIDLSDEKVSVAKMWGMYNEEETNQKNVINDLNETENNKKLPLGFFSLFERRIYILILVLSATIFFILFMLLLILNPKGFGYYLLAFCLLDVVINFSTVFFRIHVEKKPFLKYEKTLDLDSFLSEVDTLVNNPVHEETKNYILMQKKYYLSYISNEKAKMVQTFKPQVLNYYLEYIRMRLDFYLLHDDKEGYKNFYLSIKETPIYNLQSFKKIIYKSRMTYELIFSAMDSNGLKNYRYDTKNQFNNAINLLYQARYYKLNGNLNKVYELKNLFYEKYSFLLMIKEEFDKL